MDEQKNIDKDQIPDVLEQPTAETEDTDELDDMQMQPLPMVEGNTTSTQMPNMNMPRWNWARMSGQPEETEMKIEEQPDEVEMPEELLEDIPVEEIEDSSSMRGYRTCFDDYSSFDYNSFDYREFNHFDHYDHNDFDDVDDILRKIERYNPGIFRRLASYGVPFPVARNIVRRIIRLTLNYK